MSPEQQLWDTFQHMAPLFHSMESGEDRPGGAKKHKGNHQQEDPNNRALWQMVSTLGRLILKHDAQLEDSRRGDTYIVFFGRSPTAVLPKLLTSATKWQQDQKTAKTTGPLRQHLMLTMMQELHAKIECVSSMKTTDPDWTTLLEKKIILEDGRWPFLRWQANTKKLEPSQETPLKIQQLGARVKTILEHLQDPDSIVRFHAMKPITEETQVSTWKLQLDPRNDELYNTLGGIMTNSAWQLLCVSLKKHTHWESPLATHLRKTMFPQKGKGKGKGKQKP